MKLKVMWLVLPLVLLALMLGLRWRVEHPPLTQADLAIRALLDRSPSVNILYRDRRYNSYATYLPREKRKAISDNFYRWKPQAQNNWFTNGGTGTINLTWHFNDPKKNAVTRIYAALYLGGKGHNCVVVRSNQKTEYLVHPVTAKRWIELLMADPELPPALRAQMQSE